jgi:biotin transport system substrate-specific component
MAGAHAVIYLLGATWLALFLGVGPAAAFTLGVAPFLAGDAVKVVAAAALAPALVRLRG